MARFELFGLPHLAAVATIALLAITLTRASRKLGEVGFRRLSRAYALFLVLLTGTYFAYSHAAGTLEWSDVVPLQLCDLAIVLGVIALMTSWWPVRELLYFWALSGTAFAILTPDLAWQVTHPSSLFYFALHGAVVIAAVLATWGAKRYPPPSAPWRVLLATNVYAALLGVVNAVTGENFMYLSRKPEGATILDYLGPWPIYIAATEFVALALFLLIARLTPRDPPRR